MPNREPVVLQQDQFKIRHVGPQASIWPAPPAHVSTFALLNQAAMIARPLPVANVPASPDFVNGFWTGRLGDAGEAQLIFPNATSSDGLPWKDRFDPTGHLQFIEVKFNGFLDFAGVIDQVQTDQQGVTVHAYDAFWLLKKAYVRDWIVTQAPRDVIERGTQVWQPLIVDNFASTGSSVPGSQWTISSAISANGTSSAAANDPTFDPLGTGDTLPWTISSTSTVSTTSATLQGTDGFQATGFGFSIPGGSTIIAVEFGIANEISFTVGIESGGSNGVLVIGGAATGFEPRSSIGGLFGLSASTLVLGGSSDDWNGGVETLTPALVNASNFGVELQGEVAAFGGGTASLEIHAITATVWYTNTNAVSIRPTGGLSLNVPAVINDLAAITSTNVPCSSPVWMAESSVFQLPTTNCEFGIKIFESGNPVVQVDIISGTAHLFVFDSGGAASLMSEVQPTAAATWDLRIESDGEWLFGFINGQLVGSVRRPVANPDTLAVEIFLASSGNAGSAVVTSAILEAQVPFLMRSATQRLSPLSRAATGADGGGSHTAWSNASNITAPGQNASASLNPSALTNLLYATNLGLSIPSNATITGYEVHLLKSQPLVDAAIVVDSSVVLVTGGTGSAGVGTNHASSANWPPSATPVAFSYGGPFDLWGASLTPAQVNGAGFGVAIQAQNTSGSLAATPQLWGAVQMVVYYTLPGPDSGDYVLPGDASTYPWGGLHARYFNDADLQSDSQRLRKIMAAPRTQAYGGSGPAEYQNQQDAALDGQANPTPGAANTNWSCRWFGAIYLKLSAGDYTLRITCPAGPVNNFAARVWVGKTRFGDELLDQWAFTNTSNEAFDFTVSASTLAGTNSDGSQTAKDGWYPIKIEWAADDAVSNGVAPSFFIITSPAAYTDPGGTAIASGAQGTVVPATSLSPLGCADQRYQGIAHFDLVQQTAQAFDHQIALKPQPLESGLFPGVLAPRLREGHDTDIVLKPDTGSREDAEGLLNYSSTLDASDFASSLQGNGAGIQTGTAGQLQADVYDPVTMLGSLFDVQQWQDFSDAAFVQLLQALLNAQLGLQLEPWQLLSADPNGRPRKAFTWPLTGTVANMRWRPGDGARMNAPLINVVDDTPRQMLVFTRNIGPQGYTSTQGTFANRPKNPARALKRQLYTATRLQRNYQRQLTTVSSAFSQATLAPGATDTFQCIVALNPSDTIVRATVRIVENSGNVPFDLIVNGSDATSTLSGPWTVVPANIDVTGVLTRSGSPSAQVKNNSGGTTSTFNYQLLVDVLR